MGSRRAKKTPAVVGRCFEVEECFRKSRRGLLFGRLVFSLRIRGSGHGSIALVAFEQRHLEVSMRTLTVVVVIHLIFVGWMCLDIRIDRGSRSRPIALVAFKRRHLEVSMRTLTVAQVVDVIFVTGMG